MATLRQIRRRISSVRSTQQITKAMKMVAAAKLRKAQERIMATRPYAQKLADTIGDLVAMLETSQNPLLQSRPIEKVLTVIVTADRGLCGAFNSNLIRYAKNLVQTYKDVESQILLVGRKGYEFFSRRDYQIFDYKMNFFNNLFFEDATEIVSKLVSAYTDGSVDKIEIVYNQFKSAVQQNITLEQFLPFIPDQEMVEAKSQIDFLYEPNKQAILDLAVPKHLNIQMWKVLLESNAAEQGARMTAMDNATENAEELIGYLTLTYNRTRQAAITKEISEIVGGAEALKEK
jgi:F-type H+-transporting ATPase subunit gamma